ncbi:hypothetical protein [Mycoplana dimorpha]|uniref:Transcriptional regulator n=1 Tax=Mycoplana dimorpha TaxID=28320 RepID=A0A2T5B339_MYCDI|nr:hypothetical protein [Mycoplana dimorpha]PTM93389.1 hypothetical protein C7449_10674 [Mycoplana dimorpha]
MTATKGEFFTPAKMSALEKASRTHAVAKNIVADEIAAREKKTERLRALRLAKASLTPEAPARKKKR